MKSRILYLLILVIVIFSCQKEELSQQDHFFVSNHDAIMPVYIKGNLESDVIILFLHGGPGGSASEATFIPSFQKIENSYAIAYWDQRASGLSQGNPDKSTFTVDQFVEDTYYVIEALNLRYPDKQIFLFGHSWGGALGAAYLSTNNYQSNISGFICMDSGHNLVDGLPLSVDWVENYATKKIELNNNVHYWTKVEEWCANNPDMTVPDNFFKYVEYVNETDAYRHDNKEVEIDDVTMGDILNSRLSLAMLTGGQYVSQNFNILELNLSGKMASITIPSLVLWGKYDGVNTLAMGYDAYNSIGTDSLQKEMVILENSAHEGYLEEPEQFKNYIIGFVAKYK